METVKDFIFLGSKITADADCSHEIKTLAPWKEAILAYITIYLGQSRQHIKTCTKFLLVKAMVFPVVMMDVRVVP